MYDPEIHNRKSMRLRNFDYAGASAYFVTVCTWQRACLFGEVVDGNVRLNELGMVVRDEWLRTPQVRPKVVLDEFVVMPNHFHAIFWITDPVGAHRCAPWSNTAPIPQPGMNDGGRAHVSAPLRRKSNSLGSIIAGFKSAATKRINALRDASGRPVWQRNYYEHVIRGERDLHAIRQYVADNPAQWEMDTNHPDRI
ncbi:transposase [Geoalkalibacter halelectricus]|uniref:transposase n=1 Tax=Geoalkalibacter halelectricus TaxID=2847045 RepID=UPI003D21F3FD